MKSHNIHVLSGKGKPPPLLPLAWIAEALRGVADRLEKRNGRSAETIRIRWIAAQVDEHERESNAGP